VGLFLVGGSEARFRRRRLTERLRIWLERGELEGGRGFWLRDAATGDALSWDDARLAAGGALVVPVAGSSYRIDELQDDAFAPGRTLALVPEPDNEHDPNALAVWDAERRLQAGYVPADVAPELALPLQALSLWEWRESGRRVGLRVLVASPEVWIGKPRA
jgi:HIRAN domain